MSALISLLLPCRVYRVTSFDLLSAMKSTRWKKPGLAPASRPQRWSLASLVRALELA